MVIYICMVIRFRHQTIPRFNIFQINYCKSWIIFINNFSNQKCPSLKIKIIFWETKQQINNKVYSCIVQFHTLLKHVVQKVYLRPLRRKRKTNANYLVSHVFVCMESRHQLIITIYDIIAKMVFSYHQPHLDARHSRGMIMALYISTTMTADGICIT